MSDTSPPKLLIAASGTGGHLFPAIAVAAELPDYQIEWLGVPDRLETKLVPACYPLHLVGVEGFQKKGLDVLRVSLKLLGATWQTYQLLRQGKFQGVFTTGGYIAAPAVIAARLLGLPVLLHESNALPGKVTRFLSRWCSVVALGFKVAQRSLPKAHTVWVGTPVRSQFLTASPELPDLPLPADVPLLVVVGGSQGAVAVNRLIRECAPTWLEAGIWIVHQTGENDPDSQSLQHPHYFPRPFYDQMAGLLKRADLVIGRSGAGTLTELAIAQTPSILIPYPFAAEDHQTVNARVFSEAGAALLMPQKQLTAARLTEQVLALLKDGGSAELKAMAAQTAAIAVPDSAVRVAKLIRECLAASQRASGSRR